MKVFKHLYKNIDTSKFQMVSLSIDDDIQRWLDTCKQDTVIWKSYVDKGGWNSDRENFQFNLYTKKYTRR